MNPFTRFLRQWTDDKDLHTFIEHCDALEALVVRVYKRGEASAADEAEYQALRRWLGTHYPAWRKALRPCWKAGDGHYVESMTDPFQTVLEAPCAADFVGNWRIMQQLPTAREALNRLVLKRSGENGR